MISERKIALQHYMDELARNPGIARSYEMLRFLAESDVDLATTEAPHPSEAHPSSEPSGAEAATGREEKKDDSAEDAAGAEEDA